MFFSVTFFFFLSMISYVIFIFHKFLLLASDTFSFFSLDFCFEVFFTFSRLVVNSDPRHSLSSISRRVVSPSTFLESSSFSTRCPPSLLPCLFLPILPRLFGRPGRPVTSRPRSRVSKLRRAMSVYFMRGIISSEGNRSIIPR